MPPWPRHAYLGCLLPIQEKQSLFFFERPRKTILNLLATTSIKQARGPAPISFFVVSRQHGTCRCNIGTQSEWLKPDLSYWEKKFSHAWYLSNTYNVVCRLMSLSRMIVCRPHGPDCRPIFRGAERSINLSPDTWRTVKQCCTRDFLLTHLYRVFYLFYISSIIRDQLKLY
jgi:hypothetical protein